MSDVTRNSRSTAGPETVPGPQRGRIAAWAAWDWGSAAFNAVMTTFVFTVYLTSDAFGGKDHASAVLGWALGFSGLAIALFAPVSGQRADASGRRKFWLGANSAMVALLTAACFFVQPAESYLLLGVSLIALANIFFEFAGVNYNAMLLQISTPKTIGKISGIGWAMGYLGGIVALLIVYVGFISPDVGWFGVTDEAGLNIRAVALFAAVWFGVFAVPVLVALPQNRAASAVGKVSFVESYRILGHTIARLYREERHTLYFLVSSAIFRDGLAAVFTFGAVIAVGTFGFTSSTVLIFAIAGNIVAAAGAAAAGLLDDRLGPKRVIVISLVGLVLSAGTVMFLTGSMAFWICGLFLCLFVGPAQSASRSFLGRLTAPNKEGELFGLYATTGRAVSFLAPTLFAVCITVFGSQRWGIIGIVAVLLLGLLTLLPVRSPARHSGAG